MPFLDQALYTLDLLPASRVIEIAEYALQNGHESEAILRLVSLFRNEARWFDIKDDFECLMVDIGVRKLTRHEAQVVVARHLASQYLEKRIGTRAFLDDIYALADYGRETGAADHPDLRNHLSSLDYLDSMYSEAVLNSNQRAMAIWEKDIRTSCELLLAEVRESEE